MTSLSRTMQNYTKEHLSLYVFIAVILITGVVFGAVMVNALTLEQKQEIGRHLGSFLQSVDQGLSEGNRDTFFAGLLMHWKWVLLIWIFGLSVIGLPLILVLDFLKGVLIGFTVGYMIGQYSWKGMLFALAGVVPQNMIVLPVIVVCSVTAMSFSLDMIKQRFWQRSGTVVPPFMRYSLTTAVMAMLLIAASIYEAFLSPAVLKWVSPMLTVAQAG
ncbi:stage II sporulation protein M [Paenibacillus contaminans]|nr:stage II sporulation protein M [Paenibacillus contaminans]